MPCRPRRRQPPVSRERRENMHEAPSPRSTRIATGFKTTIKIAERNNRSEGHMIHARTASSCKHDKGLYTNCSPAAQEYGFARLPQEKRIAATTHSGRYRAGENLSTPEEDQCDSGAFPAPLVLPEHALAIDPKEPPQSFKSWHSTVQHYATGVTSKRNAIYVIPPPEISPEVQLSSPVVVKVPRGKSVPKLPASTRLEEPKVEDLCEYLSAFYHRMPVKIFTQKLKWVPWTGRLGKTSGRNQRIGLETSGPRAEVVGVRIRESIDGVAPQQLNLCDILDAMLPIVPADAQALVMVLPQDTYEDPEDDFCCGRAFGGSHIAVVSTFRYNPCLDRHAEIDLQHTWPLSHCKTFADEQCGIQPAPKKRRKASPSPIMDELDQSSSALGSTAAAATHKIVARTKDEYSALWLSRVARTLSHEVGHCLTLDHCVYYACAMQSTASIAEDSLQPPYLCPVCLQKLSYNLLPLMPSGSAITLQRDWIEGQHEALLEFCRKWPNVGLFVGFEAWLEARLRSIIPWNESKRPVPPGSNKQQPLELD